MRIKLIELKTIHRKIDDNSYVEVMHQVVDEGILVIETTQFEYALQAYINRANR
jgi:hypothetical protein